MDVAASEFWKDEVKKYDLNFKAKQNDGSAQVILPFFFLNRLFMFIIVFFLNRLFMFFFNLRSPPTDCRKFTKAL
jgi:hypothetical protein